MVRILTVGASDTSGEAVAREVSELGVAVERARTESEALERLAATPYELVILDLAAPGEGAGALVRMRELGNAVPVLVLVSEGRSGALLPALVPLLKLGVEGFLVKPPKPGELARRVLRALRRAPSSRPVGGAP